MLSKLSKRGKIILSLFTLTTLGATAYAQSNITHIMFQAEQGTLSGGVVTASTDSLASGGSHISFQAVTPPSSSGDFIETFSDGEGWRDRFDTHVHFRADHDNPPGTQPNVSWRADHDHNCGGADTERQVHAHNRAAFFYACRDHMMTTMADIDGYGTIAFAPKQTFQTVSQVCWDQNVTDLGGRQWTEVVITPAHLIPGGEIAHVNSDFEAVDNTATHHGTGTLSIKIMQRYDGFRAYVSRQQQAFEPHPGFDSAGFESRAIRRQHCITDNQNGTTTFSVDRGSGGMWTHTFNGSFPTNARVVFEDHNYTPDKDGEACRSRGVLTGCRYTWHWDNIIVRR